MNLNRLTISEAKEGLKKKNFSASELVSDCLSETEKKQGLRAFLELNAKALEEARRADEMISSSASELPALFGIPFGVKDNILVEGRVCTSGSKILENYIAPYDATVIRKLKNQGAIILGKTNMDEFAMGSSTENSAFGPSRNPLDETRVPGGSSGGSAVAVAADLVLGALGSDTGGSIRQPAAFCGVVGFKPTYGTVSRHGLTAMASSLDQIGPLAKTVQDAKLIFQAITGRDYFDSTSSRENFSPESLEQGIENTRVGVPKEYFTSGLDKDVEEIIRSALLKLEKAGAKVEEINLPHSSYALPAYYIVAPSEVSANLARYDGIRFGFSAPNAKSLLEAYETARQQGFGTEVKRRIILGTYALSSGYYDAYYLKAQKVRRLIRDDFEEAFKKVDVVAGPTVPFPAFKFGEKTEDPLEMYLADIYTVAVNLAGVPAISIPAGNIKTNDKLLPVGLQIIGPRFQDNKLLNVAAYAEKILNFPFN